MRQEGNTVFQSSYTVRRPIISFENKIWWVNDVCNETLKQQGEEETE